MGVLNHSSCHYLSLEIMYFSGYIAQARYLFDLVVLLLAFRLYISGKETFLHFVLMVVVCRKLIPLHQICLASMLFQPILLRPEGLYQT